MSWRPEIAVDLELARALIHEQFPQLDRVEPLASGWDYTAFRVDHVYVFRFPRRAVVLTRIALAPMVSSRAATTALRAMRSRST